MEPSRTRSTSSVRRRSVSPFPRSGSALGIQDEAATLSSTSLIDRSQLHTVAEDDSDASNKQHLLPNSRLSSPVASSAHPRAEDHAVAQKASSKQNKPISWLALPKKGQLAILVLSRLAEPLAQTSMLAYMYFMLQSFDPSASPATISAQAGVLGASFTGAQCLTAVWWGRAADKPWMGRKRVLILGNLGTGLSVLCFGFSRSFASAAVFRSMGGALNGNVGVLRTMISEIVIEKKFQPKAFVIMPLTYNVGYLIGPIIGGFLQDPVNSFPSIFGPGSALGGATGVRWMIKYPYALPNLINAAFLLFSALVVFLGSDETLVELRNKPDPGRRVGKRVVSVFRWLKQSFRSQGYSVLSTAESDEPLLDALELEPHSNGHAVHNDSHGLRTTSEQIRVRPKLPFRRIFTKNLTLTFISHGLMALHVGTFTHLWFLFLSTPRAEDDPAAPISSLPRIIAFTGGLGWSPSTIGVALGILGAMGLVLQFGVYSRVTHRLGVLRTFRFSLLLFPLVYTLAPFIATLSSQFMHGAVLWMAVVALLFIQVVARTFCQPAAQILVNNCSPHPSVLGVVHGMAQSVSSGMRTIGPLVWSILYGVGLDAGVVGLAWWCLALEALAECAVSWFLREGDGHEILLEGDEDV